MTTEMPKKSPVKFLLTIIGLAAIAMVATVIIGYSLHLNQEDLWFGF